ncbi:MAG: hypothetical protein KI786_10110 [Mameliella sp.]|nr:hypothetical protein [Phaeodactylibacter sp.]NRA50052.1 hypothetical protein [Phaeodactylibacter sp.]
MDSNHRHQYPNCYGVSPYGIGRHTLPNPGGHQGAIQKRRSGSGTISGYFFKCGSDPR